MKAVVNIIPAKGFTIVKALAALVGVMLSIVHDMASLSTSVTVTV